MRSPMLWKIVSVGLLLICQMNLAGSLKILGIFPLHGKSHFVMCESLAKSLAKAGHEIDVYSHFPLKKSLQNYNDFSLEGTIPKVVNNMSYDMVQTIKSINMEVMQNMVGEPVCELLGLPIFQQLIKSAKERSYDIVIVEVFVQNCYLAFGRHLNIPMVGVITSSVLDWLHEPLGNPYNTAVQPGLWSGFLSPMNFWERLANTVLYRLVMSDYNYYIGQQDKQVKKYFGPGYPKVNDLAKDLDLVLVNSHYSLDGIKPFVPAIVPIAGIHIVDDNSTLPREVQTWLDESPQGCVYVSFGSMVRLETFPREVVLAFYRAFENVAPVRILMKIAQPNDLPEGLPKNVITQSWFNQVQVLKHKNIRAFITHGGLMGTQESIRFGVPMIGVPLFADQFLNIQSYVKRNIAVMVSLSDLNENSLTTAIMEILRKPLYTKNIKKLSDEFYDRPMDPVSTAKFWVEYIARHGKGALRSPIVDMPWWQAALLDVYGFIIVVALISLCIVILILKKILKVIFSINSNVNIIANGKKTN